MSHVKTWLAIAAAVVPFVPEALFAAGPVAKLPQRVLYAGKADDARTREFVAFLESHFAEVGQVDYSAFKPSDADRYDVIVFDAPTKPRPGAIGLPTPPVLPSGFNRASVLIAGAGVNLGRELKLKLDWL